MYFTIHEDLILHSIDMYVLNKENEGTRKITITTHEGNIQTAVFPLLTEGKNTVRFDVNLSPGKYTINCDHSDQAMNAGDYNYPYPLGGIGNIDSCSGNANFTPIFLQLAIFKSAAKVKSERNIYTWLANQRCRRQRWHCYLSQPQP